MEHIRQFDWCYSQPDIYFLKEEDFANSVTEKILRNKFRDPLISSDSEDEGEEINWDEVFSNVRNVNITNRVYVPGLQPQPIYPKVSSITRQQHIQCLKVLCSLNPHILESEFIPRPTKCDYKVFEDIRKEYENEQKEFMQWAKAQWSTNHCIRALRPKPPVETSYEARFKLRATELKSFPKNYALAAQIPLNSTDICELVHVKDLVKVDLHDLPKINCDMSHRITIMKHFPVPEPCEKHNCRFVLPLEKTVTELPLTEVHRELAQYAADNGAQFIASESALQCLVEMDRSWNLPVSVCSVFGLDGETKKVVVLGSDFSIKKESVLKRTYIAFKYLLEKVLVPAPPKKTTNKENTVAETTTKITMEDLNLSSDEEDALHIDDDSFEIDQGGETSNHSKNIRSKKTEGTALHDSSKEKSKCDGFYNCSCKGTFEAPSPRSFRKWQIKTKNQLDLDIIVHCSHKCRDEDGEILLEAVPEYQLDLGASEPSHHHKMTLALALKLRPNASLLTARIDNASGDVVTVERERESRLRGRPEGGEAAVRLRAALLQLPALLPQQYVLRHEPSHGDNAMLYVAKASATDLILNFVNTFLENDDAQDLKTAPTLAPILLPVHKYRKLLPCAFSPFDPPRAAKARARAAARQRTPPQALKLDTGAAKGGARSKWPKKKKKAKSKR